MSKSFASKTLYCRPRDTGAKLRILIYSVIPWAGYPGGILMSVLSFYLNREVYITYLPWLCLELNLVLFSVEIWLFPTVGSFDMFERQISVPPLPSNSVASLTSITFSSWIFTSSPAISSSHLLGQGVQILLPMNFRRFQPENTSIHSFLARKRRSIRKKTYCVVK